MTDVTIAQELDVHDWIVRNYGVSTEDAYKIVGHVIKAHLDSWPDPTPTHDLAAVFGDDQVHAAVQRVSASVAAHYATLRQTGMPDKRAAQLCAAMQEQWLAGVLPVPAEAMAYMREDAERGEGLE